MEFQEGLMRLIIQDAEENHCKSKREKKKEKSAETGNPRRKWKLFHRSSTAIPTKAQSNQPPSEFLCPITGSLMAEPVIVSSGHSFERACVEICKALDFIPTLQDDSTPDFSSVIPNLALKSTIISWCQKYSVNPPNPLDSNSAEKLVRTLMATQDQKPKTNQMKSDSEDNEILIKEKLVQLIEPVTVNFNHATTKVPQSPIHFQSKSLESIETTMPSPPLPLATRPSCYSSSSSSSEIETLPITPEEEDEILTKLKSQHVFEVEEALITMRKITRTREESRPHLCSYQLLSALKSLIVSRYTGVQVNSVAALVNLSLDNTNKMKILRSGIVPPLIDVLKGGSKEAQEHAAGAIFSLALNDDNKTAIGVLGALPPLLHLLRSESERTRHDAALALYHLTLVQTNRTKLVKLGAVPNLLYMAKSGHMTSRILLVLGNLGSCTEGRVALLDAGAVGSLVEMLKGGQLGSVSARESCVAVLYTLSYGGLRFKALAKTAGAVDALWKVETVGTERGKQKAKMIMEIMKGRGDVEEDEDVDWEDLLESDSDSHSHSRLFVGGGGITGSKHNSSEF
ncbi:U-box domain-containing protein 40-like [Humulus lupulus]|uniref:U-box domain-containing protein 40-like n=1 Tax=Humulus lupulus TaxID=3486 RepID=UPI002B415275|nr:U-box domain-containing protein 40-like [Humulus lupulus]